MQAKHELIRTNAPGESRPATDAAADAFGLVKKRDVARAASVSARCVENWMAGKRIPFIRLSPRCVRFDLQRVLAALRRFEVKEVTRAK
jgi:hypothetical protein